MILNLEHLDVGNSIESSYDSMPVDPPYRMTPDRFSGGLDVNLVNAMPERYKCPFCKKLMRDPVQSLNPPCEGDRACRSCYSEAEW